MSINKKLEYKPGTYLEEVVPVTIEVLISIARGVLERDQTIDPDERRLIAQVARDVEESYKKPNSSWIGKSLPKFELPPFDYDKYIGKED